MNPVVSSSTPKVSEPRERAPARVSTGEPNRLGVRETKTRRSGAGMKVRKLERGADDGYASGLVPGLHSSRDAERLADELAFAAARLDLLASDPPAVFAPMIDPELDLEERTWIAVQWELDPEADRVSWTSGQHGTAYRAWAERSGSQQAAITGEAYWTPERRFERTFERLGALGGFDRDVCFDLLVVLGRLGLYELEAGKLFPSGENETTWSAKRALGIGDPLLLERRAADLAEACAVPIAALDLGFRNWGSGSAGRSGRGVPDDLTPDPERVSDARDALGV